MMEEIAVFDFKKNTGPLLISTYKYRGKIETSVCAVNSLNYENTELNKLIRELAQTTP